MRVGFQVPQRHSSLPLAGSWAVSASPPAIRMLFLPSRSKGMGVVKASRDSARASLGRTWRQRVFPVMGSIARR